MRYVNLPPALLAVFLIFVSPAWGQEVGINRLHVRQVDNGGQGDLAGTVTNDLLIDFTGELRGQQLRLELAEGTIYQHPQGTNFPPDSELVPIHPNLAYDTFVAMGGADSTSSALFLIVRDFDDPPPFGSSYAFVKWIPATGVAILDESDFLTARLTLSDDAQGTWKYFGSVSGGDPGRVFDSGVIVNGVIIVPEPATAILAVSIFLSSIRSGHSLSPSLRS